MGTLDLILWRHAEAQDGTPDHARALTAKGSKQAEKMATFLRRHLPEQTRILVSPAVRTRQTVTALTTHFVLTPAISPGASAQAIFEATDWPHAEGTVLVVGHQPTLGEVAAHLLDSTQTSLSIRKGAIWWFCLRQREGQLHVTLRMVVTPEFL